MGTLYLVATPIGNLEDITRRALRILQDVPLIAAEDTRRTGQLLRHYGLQKKPISYREHNKERMLPELLKALEAGDVALVSDAGTPALNDPGYELVRAAWEAGHRVSPIPGPAAPIAALVASGLPTDAFLYQGYLPRRKSERQRKIEQIAHLPYTLVFLETPHRLLAALADLEAALGDRPVAVARELTKLHEEIFRGSLSEAQAHFSATGVRGEITLIVAGDRPGEAAGESEPWDEARLRQALRQALRQEERPGQIARDLAQKSGWDRRAIYRLLTKLRHEAE